MQTVRRLYLYAVAFVSLEVVLWGGISLARAFISGRDQGRESDLLASGLALILVGVPVFLLHWAWAQRSARLDPEEGGARLRAVFLYGVSLAVLVPVVQNLLSLLARGLTLAFGLPPGASLLGSDQALADNLIAILANGLAALYFFFILRHDWAAGARGEFPTENLVENRRLYRYAWLLYSLALAAAGLALLLQYIFHLTRLLSGPGLDALASGLALLAVGAPLWLYTSRVIQRALADPPERGALLRLGVLYFLALLGLLGALLFGGVALSFVLQIAFNSRLTLPDFLPDLTDVLATAIPLAAIGAWYGSMLRLEMRTAPLPRGRTQAETVPISAVENRRHSLRRLYLYILALAGLASLFSGLYLLIRFVIEVAIHPNLIVGSATVDLAAALALLIVGAPLWFLAWRPLVREAARPDELGDHARRSLVRKVYLYLALFAGVMGVMLSAGLLLYNLLRLALGDAPPDLLLTASQQVAGLLLFGLLLAYHAVTLRRDGGAAQRALARRYARFPVLVLYVDEPTPEGPGQAAQNPFANAMVEALRRLAPDLPVATHPVSLGVPDETLSSAQAVVLPGELSARPPESIRLWLQGFSGMRLVVPTPAPRLHWVAGSGRSLNTLARQAALAVRQLAEGEEIGPPRDASPWMTVVYVLAGLFLVQIAFLLFTLVLSLVAR